MALSVVFPALLWLLLLLPLFWLFAWATWTPNRLRLGRRRYFTLLGVRSVLLAALILALAGAQVGRAVDDTAVVFLIDGSDSVAPAQREQALAYVNAALAAGQPSDRAAVVLFGATPAVERAAAPLTPLRHLTSVVRTSRTDLAAAVQLGLALLPADAQKRIVLLSDGAENQGSAATAARLAALRGVPITVVPLRAERGPDVFVAAVTAPGSARAGQTIPVVVRLVSGQAGPAEVAFFADDQLVTTLAVALPVGTTDLTVQIPAGEPGFRRFTVRVSAPADTEARNNSGAAFTQVDGPPRVLLVAAVPERAAPLQAALAAGTVTVDRLDPAQLPGDPTVLRQYAAVVLIDTPANLVAPAAQRALVTYVRDQGGGLAMLGGSESFGAGGWRRTPLAASLPVELDPKSETRTPDLALALVLDRSGSMGEAAGAGRDRLSLAKEAVYLASQGLATRDQLGVYVFDDAAQTILTLQPLPDLFVLEEALSQASIGGGTNIRAGVALAAPALAAANARIKHMILLTDGLDDNNYGDLIDQLRAQGTTVTIVSIGGDANPNLAGLAARGGGAFYRVETAQDVPRIFLSETIRIAGRDLVEGALTPLVALNAPPVRGLGALPTLYGYNATTARAAARTIVVAPNGAPLLAVWQVGLGRTLAWTSDLKGQWAKDWLGWANFAPFAQGLIDALLPPPAVGRLSLTTSAEGATAILNAVVSGEDGRPATSAVLEGRLLDPAGQGASLHFTQVGVGRYRAVAPADVPGVYLAQIVALDANGQALGTASGGLVVTFSPEYGPNERGPILLSDLAALTGGQVAPPPASLFASAGQPVGRVTEIALPLLWLVLALLPLDIGLRRLFLHPRTFWLPRRTTTERSEPPLDPAMARLQAARARAHRPLPPTAHVPPPEPPHVPAAPPVSAEPPSPPDPDDAVAALLAAQARRKR